jgi:hypothetical protein
VGILISLAVMIKNANPGEYVVMIYFVMIAVMIRMHHVVLMKYVKTYISALQELVNLVEIMVNIAVRIFNVMKA